MLDQIEQKKTERKRIGIIHYTLPPGISGVEMVIRDHARLLSTNGYRIFLLGASGKKFRSEINVHLIPSIDPKNGKVQEVQNSLKKRKLTHTFESLKKVYKRKIKKWIEENRIQIVIAHNLLSRHYNLALTAAVVSLAEELKDNVKFISWIHDASFIDTFYTHTDSALKNVYPWNLIAHFQNNFTYVTISETRKKELKQLYGKGYDITVIPNGLDVNKMLPLPLQTRTLFKDILSTNPDYIGMIPVRITERKNIEYAFDFVHKAKEAHNLNFVFIITGALHLQNPETMKYRDYLLSRVKKEHLEKNIFFLYNYKLSNGEMFDVYKLNIRDLYLIADFLFFPSKGEGFGLPIIEAGFMRIPAFVSDLPVFKEVGNGYINSFSLSDPIDKNVNLVISYLKKSRATLFHKIILKKYSLEEIVKKQFIPMLNGKLSESR